MNLPRVSTLSNETLDCWSSPQKRHLSPLQSFIPITKLGNYRGGGVGEYFWYLHLHFLKVSAMCCLCNPRGRCPLVPGCSPHRASFHIHTTDKKILCDNKQKTTRSERRKEKHVLKHEYLFCEILYSFLLLSLLLMFVCYLRIW